ncbi:glycosyltransferase family 4 protein [Pseudomonadota bacterium]
MEQAFINYAESLILQGNEVVCIIKTDAPYVRELESIGVKIYKVKNRFGYSDYPLIWKIRNVIRRENIDIGIAHAGRAISLLKRASKKLCPVVAVNHSSNIKRSIGADAVFVINSEAEQAVIKKGQNKNSVFLVPNMIKLLGRIPSRKKEGKVLVIGAMARLVKAKGMVELINAIDILNKKGVKVKLVIAGVGEEKDNLKSLVRGKKLEKNVRFLGWLEEKEEFYNLCDIFCLPSLFEPFGIVLLEAMLYKKPIVATNSEGPRDIFVNGKDVIIVSKDNPEELPKNLAKGIEKLVKSKVLRNKLAKNAHKNLIANYSMDAVGFRLKKTLGCVVKLYNKNK